MRTLFAYAEGGTSRRSCRRSPDGERPEPRPRTFPLERQKEFELEVVERFGFDDTAWRLDPTVHPFATRGGDRRTSG